MPATKQLTRAAILLTLALIFQSLRVLLPLPHFLSAFIIGSLVNAVLAFAAWRSVLSYALSFSAILPIVAYLQGQLPIPILIPVVILGNWLYILLIYKYQSGKGIYLAPFAKAVAMYTTAVLAMQFFDLPLGLQKTMGFMMGIAQLVTGFVGIFLARLACRTVR